MGVPSPTVLALLGCGYARFHAGANFALKLSEKGFERRSERGIGRYIGAKIGRTVRCRGSVQLSFGCLQDFSDSFLTEFCEVRSTWGCTPHTARYLADRVLVASEGFSPPRQGGRKYV